MKRIEDAVAAVRSEDRVGLMTHVVVGYPDLATTRHLVEAMVDEGADIIELQIPFSDPTADGPAITAANQAALSAGVRTRDAFALAADLSARVDVPLVFMSYFNIVLQFRGPEGTGVRAFARAAAGAGVSGLIVPDIPPEEGGEGFPEACRAAGIHPIRVISPNVSDARLTALAETASGLVYSTARTGTTGREVDLDWDGLRAFLGRARERMGVALAVGFGIRRREAIERLRGVAEFGVVGSHLLAALEAGGVEGVRREIRSLRGG